MVAFSRWDGLSFIAFVDVHSHHVHVLGGHARFNFPEAGGGPALSWAEGMAHGDIRRAMGRVAKHREASYVDGRKFKTELTDSQIDAALERGRIANASEPRAAGARYDKRRGKVTIDLTNGCTFAFPRRIAQGIETATADQLSKIEIIGHGYGLRWETLNVDLSIPGLMAGRFGTSAYMAWCAKHGTSPAIAYAARAKAAKGARPRKAATD